MIKKYFLLFTFYFVITILSAQAKFIEIKKDNFIFKYRYTDTTIDIIVSTNTMGWIGVGFNPTMKMKDANYIIGYIKDNNVYIEDHFGTSPIEHKKDTFLGGTEDIYNVSGIEKDGITEISFSIARNPKDKFDTEIKKGKNTILLAMGLRDDFTSKHVSYTKFEIILK